MAQVSDTFFLTISGSNLLLHLLGSYLLISVYKKRKKTVQQLLLINLSLTEFSTSLILVTETSVKMAEGVLGVTNVTAYNGSNNNNTSYNNNNTNKNTSKNKNINNTNKTLYNSYNLNSMPMPHQIRNVNNSFVRNPGSEPGRTEGSVEPGGPGGRHRKPSPARVVYTNIFMQVIFCAYYMSMIYITADRFFAVLLNMKYPIYWNVKKTKFLLLANAAVAVGVIAGLSIQYSIQPFRFGRIFTMYVHSTLNCVVLLLFVATYSFVFYKYSNSQHLRSALQPTDTQS